MTSGTTELKTKFPITLLDLLGREWHAQYYVSQVTMGCKGAMTAYIRGQAEIAVKQALASDYY